MPNTTIWLTAEQIAQAAENFTGPTNQLSIERAFGRQTPREVFVRAITRARRWPQCGRGAVIREGVQYAYLLEFLITNELAKEHEEVNHEQG